MNLTALRWTLEIVSALAALAQWCEGGLTAEIKINGPAKLRAGDTLEVTFVASGTDGMVHFAPHLKPLDESAKAAMADRKVLRFTAKDRSSATISCYEGVYSLELTITTPDDDATASVTIDVPRGADCAPCPKPVPPTPEPPTPTPIPPAPPTPTPPPMPPAPTVPIGQYNVAPKIAAFVKALNDPTKGDTATKLIVDLEAISQQINEGKITGVSGLTTAIGLALKNTGKSQWIESSVDVTKVISEAYEAHKNDSLALTTLYGFKHPEGYATLIHEAAVGVNFGVK